MSRALFWTTLKLSHWAVLSWALFLVLYDIFIVALFPSMQKTPGLEEYIRGLPEGLRRMGGLTDELLGELFASGRFSFEGWLAVEYFAWWPVVVGIYGFMFGAGAIAREAEEGTMEILLSHPIPRYRVVASKFAAFLVIAAVLVASTIVGILLGLPISGLEVDIARLILVASLGGLVVVSIGSLSMLLSCLFLDRRKSMAIAGGIMAASYVLNLLGPALGPLGWLQKLSLFYYFRPTEVLLKGSFPLPSVLFYLGVTAACFAVALMVFQRRKAVL